MLPAAMSGNILVRYNYILCTIGYFEVIVNSIYCEGLDMLGVIMDISLFQKTTILNCHPLQSVHHPKKPECKNR